MICRRPAALALAAAAPLVLAAWVAPVRAGALSASSNPSNVYVLTSGQDIPASPTQPSNPLVVFEAPPNSVLPGPVDPATGKATSPVTPVTTPFVATDGKTYSTDPQYSTSNDVFVFTREATSAATGKPVEDVGFAFKNGLSHSAAFVFSLNVADPKNPPALTAITPGVANYPFPAPAATTSPTTTTVTTTAATGGTSLGRPPVDQPVPGPSVPEPFSLALWSALTAAGLVRARACRRRCGV